MTSNMSVILKPRPSFYDDLFKRYRLRRLTNKLRNENPDIMVILYFLDSPYPKTCKSAKNWKPKICSITKFPISYDYGGY